MPSVSRLLWCAAIAAAASHSLRAQHRLGPQGSFDAPKIAAASDEGEKNLKRFQIPSGWKSELWAAEPMLGHPVSFDVADDGRVYVVESFRAWRGVPDIRGIMDWLDEDLACKSVEDRLMMMRRHLGVAGMKDYAKNTERIQVLWDSKGAGKADVSKVFAENFATPLDGVAAGVLARGNDVWFANIPNVWRLHDDDHDGVADRRESISYGHGIRVGFLGHDLHGLAWGPDGKLYFSIGDRASVLKVGGRTVGTPDSGAVFRCNPDGTGMEMFYSGLRNPQELVFDEWGNLFTGDNNSDGGDQARWTYLIEGGDSGWRIGWQFLEGSDAPQPRGPWNMEKMWHPQNDVQPAFLTPPIKNISAGPSGVAYYPGTGLGAEWQGTFTLCDFRGSGAGSGIWQFKHKPKGASFEIVEDKKFVWAIEATDGTWGPDGAYWITDWVDGWEPVGKGRIYRFYDPAHVQAPEVVATAKLLREGFARRNEKELLGLLSHPNFRVRQNAQFELAAKGEPAIKALAGVARGRGELHGRLHAMWALGQVADASRATARGARSDALEPVLALAGDPETHVRANVARILGDARYQPARDALAKLASDADAHVRALGIIGLGHLGRRDTLPVALEVLRANADKDPHLRHAAVQAIVESAQPDDLLAAAGDPSEAVRMGVLLAMRRLERNEIARFLGDASVRIVTEAARAINDVPIAGAMPDLAALASSGLDWSNTPLARRVVNANLRFGTKETAATLVQLAKGDAPAAVRAESLVALAAWPRNAGRDRVTGLWRPTAFARDAKIPGEALAPVAANLLASAPNPVRKAAADAVAALRIDAATPALADLVVRQQGDGPARVAALNALFKLGAPELAAALEAGAKDPSEDVRKAATKLSVQAPPTAARGSGPAAPAPAAGSAVAKLVAVIQSGTTSEKQNALAALAGVAGAEADQELGRWFADFVAGKVAPELALDVLDAASKRPALKDAVARYEAGLDPKDDIAKWRTCLAGGNVAEGKKIFLERAEVSCVRCHKVNGEGGEVGPELTGIITRQKRDYILQSIVHPNASIAAGFESALVTLKNGTTYAGVIKSDGADELELNSPEDGLLKIKKSDIKTREKGLSGMPEGFADQLTRADLRNLVEFLASLK